MKPTVQCRFIDNLILIKDSEQQPKEGKSGQPVTLNQQEQDGTNILIRTRVRHWLNNCGTGRPANHARGLTSDFRKHPLQHDRIQSWS